MFKISTSHLTYISDDMILVKGALQSGLFVNHDISHIRKY